MSKPVSLAEVAEHAGVSKSTASVVLSRGDRYQRISEPCIKRVEEAARSLGYVPHYAMSAMRRGRSDTIALPLDVFFAPFLQPESCRVHTDYFDQLWSGLRVAAQKANFSPLQVLAAPNRNAVEHALMALRGRRVDGLVVPASLDTVDVPKLERKVAQMPIVLVDAFDSSTFPSVRFDTAQGVKLMMEHLKELGHRDVLWFGPRHHPQPGKVDREREFVTTAWDLGMRGRACRFNPPINDFEGLLNGTRDSLTEYLRDCGTPLPFTAIVCFSDMFAIGAMQALHALNVRVPDDVSVVGFDDIQAFYACPALTTIDHRLHDMGQRAAEVLIELINGGTNAIKDREGFVEVIEPKLVVRDSTAPRRAGTSIPS